MRECQIAGRAIILIDFLQPPPDRIVFFVPTEFVRINKAARCGSADNDPGQKAVAPAQPQVARRLPRAVAHVVESFRSIIRQWIRMLRLEPSEVERDDAGNSPV